MDHDYIIKTTEFQNKSFHCLLKASKNKTKTVNFYSTYQVVQKKKHLQKLVMF